MQEKKNKECLRINCVIYGQRSIEGKELLKVGYARNRPDLVSQGIGCLYELWSNRKMQSLRLKTLENAEET